MLDCRPSFTITTSSGIPLLLPAIRSQVPNIGDTLILQPCIGRAGDASSFFYVKAKVNYLCDSDFQYLLGVAADLEPGWDAWLEVGCFYAFKRDHRDLGFQL